METTIERIEPLPAIWLKDEYGNGIIAHMPHKILYWLVNCPNDPACKRYIELYPNAISDLNKMKL